MMKGVASLGIILVVIAAFLFDIVFSNGKLAGLTITGTNAMANFVAFFYVIVALPIGCGLAYFGLAFRSPIYATGGQPMPSRGSGLGSAALAVGIIAILIAFAAIGVAFAYHPSTSSGEVSSLSSQVSSLNSEISSLKTSGGSGGSVNVPPSVVPLKIDWCNTDNSGQDRFCPGNFVVNQGDIVQILFISNDTDDHTFTIQALPAYSFQINLSFTGGHDFLTDSFNAGDCSNTGTSSQITSQISGTYCVSGASVLPTSLLQSQNYYTYQIGQNPIPSNACTPTANCPMFLNVTNTVTYNNVSSAAINAGSTELWGIGSFQAMTPGIYEYFCHYHVSNGMFGYMIVLPNAYCNTHASACNIAGS